MAEEIIKPEIVLPATQPVMNVTAFGEGTAIGVVYGGIHLDNSEAVTALLQQMLGTQQPVSHAAEWALLNTERFHLFVLENEKYDCGCFSISRRNALTKHILPEDAHCYNSLSSSFIQELLNMPCLFTSRNTDFKEAPEYYPALVGKLTEIIPQGDCIKFKFYACGRFRQQFINENTSLFNLITKPVRNQLDEEHWTIRHGNLLAIVDQIGIGIR